MKIILKTIALQLLLFLFHREALAQVLNPDDFSVIMEKIQQYSAPLRTLELEFVSESEHEGKLKPEKQTYRVKIDFQKNLARWETFSPAGKNFSKEIWRCDFFDNGITTSMSTTTKKNATALDRNSPVTRVWIRRNTSPFLSELETIIEYNALLGPSSDSPKPGFQILYNGKFPFIDTKIKNIIYNNEPSIEVFSNVIAKKNTLKHELIFSKKTGALLKKTTLSGEEVDGKVVDEFMNSHNYSNFTVYKNILFPLKIVVAFKDSKAHLTIKKESLRINEPIDPNEFGPKIPGGSNVRDEINGIKYTTPILGNLEATKELEKELDAYFKSADDVK